MKFYFFLISNFSLLFVSAQQIDSASIYFSKAIEAAKDKRFKEADSLYRVSIDYNPTTNAYFNRAIVNLELNDAAGYCENLSFSAAMGDKEAARLFYSKCGKPDTIYSTIISKANPLSNPSVYQVNFRNRYAQDYLIAEYNSNFKPLHFLWAIKDADSKYSYSFESYKNSKTIKLPVKDSQDSIIPATFPGTQDSFLKFISRNINYPADAREAGVSGIVYLGITVNSLGYIQDIKLEKGIPNYTSCDFEAMRVIALCPRWKPAKFKGENVASYISLQISYKI